MRFVKPEFKIEAMSGQYILPYSYNTFDDNLRLIESAGRTCYKTEDKIGPNTASSFVKMLIDRKHVAMTEHSWYVARFNLFSLCALYVLWAMIFSKYMEICISIHMRKIYIAGSLRGWQEWDLHDKYKKRAIKIGYADEAFLMDKRQWQMFAATVRVISDRGFTHEWVRHRPPAQGQESTRFCNYSKEAFGRHVTFVIPPELYNIVHPGEYATMQDMPNWELFPDAAKDWIMHRYTNEAYYFRMLERGWKPQMARCELPTCVKTEIVTTATWKEFIHIFNLRALGLTGPPHPQMREIASPMLKEFARFAPECFGELAQQIII